MKINKLNQLQNLNLYRSAEKKTIDKDIKPKSSVNIEISNSAKELAKKIEQSEDVKYSEKVEKIRQSILAGSYKVNSEDIADKIMEAIDGGQKGSDD